MLPFPEEHEEYREIVDALQPIFIKATQEFSQIKCSLQVKMRMLRLNLVLLTKYAAYQKQFNDSYETNKRMNSYKLMGQPSHVEVANMPGLQSFMPHQARGVLELNDVPYAALLDCQAGGGKSNMMTAHSMNLLHKNLAKRIAIGMPDKLIKQFASEVNFFSKGKINVFPITTKVMDRLSETLDYDKSKIKKLIKSMPKNTLFVIGYNFMKNKRF